MVTEKQLANLIPPKKGEIRNPYGNPGARSLTSLLKEYLLTQDKKKVTVGDKIIRALAKEAMKGNVKATDLVFQRTDGKVAETIKHEGVVGIVQLIASLEHENPKDS